MKLLWKLFKIDLFNTLAINQSSNRKKAKAKSNNQLITLLIVLIFLVALIAFYIVMFSFICHAANRDNAIIIMGVGVGGFMSLLMTFGKANGVLFQSKDFELLSAMPIPTKTIVSSKVMSLLSVNYLYFNVSFIPAFIMYIVLGNFTAYTIPVGIATIICGPFFSTVICTGISYLVGLLLAKSKYKNIFSTITSILLFIVLFVGMESFQLTANNGNDAQAMEALIDQIENVFSKGYFLSTFVSKAMEGNLLYLLWFVLISVIPMIVFIYLIAINFVSINSRKNNGYKNKNFNLENTLAKEKKTNQVKSLLKKEFKTLFSVNVYAMNVIVSPIMTTLLTIIMCITMSKESGEAGFENFKKMVPFMITIFSAFAIGIFPSTGCGLSIEGKNFWILKTAPIKTEKIFIAKSLMFILLCIPFIIINVIITAFFVELDVATIVLMLLIPMIVCTAYTFLALWMNTTNAKFDWTNPTQIVKGGVGTFLVMLMNLGIDIILFVPAAIIGFGSGQYTLGMVISLIMSLIALVISYFVLFKNGVKRYERIDY